MRRILITGSSGYIGSKLVQALQMEPQVEIIVALDLIPPRQPLTKQVFYRHDIRQSIFGFLKRYDIDTVVHTAFILPPRHNNQEMEDINVGGTKSVLCDCREYGIDHLLYTSSATAYGFLPDNPVPITEEQPLRGNDDFTYSRTKRLIEEQLDQWFPETPHSARTVFRPCFVIGPDVDNPISRYFSKRFVFLPRDPHPIQFLHEEDLTHVMLHCLKHRISGIFNIGGEGTLTLSEMATILGNRPLYLPPDWLARLNSIAWNARLTCITETPSAGLDLVRYPWIVSSRKLIDTTGIQLRYSSREAFESFAGRKGWKNRR